MIAASTSTKVFFSLPVEYVYVLLKGLARDRNQRYQNVAELEDTLKKVRDGWIPIRCHVTLGKHVAHGFAHWIDRHKSLYTGLFYFTAAALRVPSASSSGEVFARCSEQHVRDSTRFRGLPRLLGKHLELPRRGRVFIRDMREFPSNGAKLQDYEAFLAIVDAGNLTQAAARLRRSLQSVSRSLSALEAQVGVVLIRRTTRVAQPTEAGLAFHRRVSSAFREIAFAEAELGDTSETLSGTLRLAGSAYFVGHYVVPAIREFSLQHPGVKFDLRISEEFTEPVRTGVDLMIRIGNLSPSPMKSRKIASLRCVAIASPAYVAERGRPENPAALAQHACIIRTSSQDARAWTFLEPDGTPLRVAVQGAFEADNAYVTMHAVLAGMGIAVMPFYHAREAIETGLAEVVLDDFTLAPTTAHAIWPSGSRTPSRARRFVDLLVQRFKRDVI